MEIEPNYLSAFDTPPHTHTFLKKDNGAEKKLKQ